MAIILYDLCGAEDRRISPYCWRTKLALAHKGLPYEARPVRFGEIETIAPGPRRTLPTVEDDGRLITDSGAIADHLEDAYPDRPSLFGGEAGRALTRFVQGWVEGVVHAGMITMVVKDIHDHLDPADQDYFRRSREQRFGRPLEEAQAGREERLEAFRRSLAPLRRTLEMQPFLGGEAPLYADYVALAAFLWARAISPFRLLADDDPVAAWLRRGLDLHDGLARRTPGYSWPAAA